MRTKSLLLFVSILAASAVLVAPAAQAGDSICVGFFTGVHDNVVVPEGAVCRMSGAVVHGNVTALRDSFLDITFSEIGGNVVGDKADGVNLQFRNTVGGNIDIKEGGPNNLLPGFHEVLVCGTTLTNGSIQVQKMTAQHGIILDNMYCSAPNTLPNGNIKVEDNLLVPTGRAEGLSVGQAQLANGNLHVFKNVSVGPPMRVMFNTVSNGDIQCYENEGPFVGGPNVGHAPNQPPPFMPFAGPNQCFGTSS